MWSVPELESAQKRISWSARRAGDTARCKALLAAPDVGLPESPRKAQQVDKMISAVQEATSGEETEADASRIAPQRENYSMSHSLGFSSILSE